MGRPWWRYWILVAAFAPSFLKGEDEKSHEPRWRLYEQGPLTAQDFRGQAPDNVESWKWAYTATLVNYRMEYQFFRGSANIVARVKWIDVWAHLDTMKSWNIRPQDQHLLDHEQGHFDLAYIVVMRAKLALPDPSRISGKGGNEEQALASLEKLLQERFEETRKELLTLDTEYDRITHHGRDAVAQEAQRRWQREQIETLRKRLAVLQRVR